jgi:hypothetical protein
VVVQPVADERDGERECRVADMAADHVEPPVANLVDRARRLAVAALREPDRRDEGVIEGRRERHRRAHEVGDRTLGCRFDECDVLVDEETKSLEDSRDQRFAGGEVVEQAALRHPRRSGRRLERRSALAVGDDEALERVEHRLSCCGRAAHDDDASAGVSVMICYYTGWTVKLWNTR